MYPCVLAPCWQEIGGVGASVPSLALHVGVRRNWRGEDYCNRRCRSPCARINARGIRRCSMWEVLNRCKLGVCVRERICRGHARNGALAPAGKRSGPGGGEDGTVHEYIHNLSVDFHASWVCSRGHHARCDTARGAAAAAVCTVRCLLAPLGMSAWRQEGPGSRMVHCSL